MTRAYYNEHDPFAAGWLRELIKAGHIAPGDVDERDIRDVTPADVRGYTQAHFFAGIGVWSYALRLAGWPDGEPVWSGSCPCQPFSAAGRGAGMADERHLWPAFFHLLEICRPPVVFGEQVGTKIGLEWLDLVSADLEGSGYAFGAADLCAAGFGAPHIRQRLFFVAHSASSRLPARRNGGESYGAPPEPQRLGATGILAHALPAGRAALRPVTGDRPAAGCGGIGELGNPAGDYEWGTPIPAMHGQRQSPGGSGSPVRGFWGGAEWLPCRDGKLRPVEPGTFPLAHGAPARVGRLRGYGNAIVAPVAAEFVAACREVLHA